MKNSKHDVLQAIIDRVKIEMRMCQFCLSVVPDKTSLVPLDSGLLNGIRLRPPMDSHHYPVFPNIEV